MTYQDLFPDPFEQPYEYWLMIKNSVRLSEDDKKRYLEAVYLDYDNPPAKSEVVA